MNWVVRNVQPEDAEAVAGILNSIIETGIYTALDTPFTTEAEREFISNFPQRGIFQVAVEPEKERIVGFQNVEPFATYTHAFDHVGIIGTYVDNTVRRQGVASSLFQATFEAMTEKGYEKVFAYVRGDNLAALATYLKQGFRIIGSAQRHAKINGRYVDEILIEKLL
jgi:L-amino acid N-acyltransferase YncA